MADKKEVKKEVKLNPINKEERAKLDFKSGDTVRVTSRIIEKQNFTIFATRLLKK